LSQQIRRFFVAKKKRKISEISGGTLNAWVGHACPTKFSKSTSMSAKQFRIRFPQQSDFSTAFPQRIFDIPSLSHPALCDICSATDHKLTTDDRAVIRNLKRDNRNPFGN
jgi:hypothetical protein